MVCVLSQRHFTLRIAPEAGSSLHQQQPCVVVAHTVPIVCPGLLRPAERETATCSATAGPLYSAAQRSPPARRTGWSRRPRRQWAEQQRMGCGATSTPDREVSSRARVSHLLVHAPYRVVRNNGHHSTLAEGPRQTLVLAEEPLRKEGFQALRSQGSVAASHPPAPPELQLS